MKPLLALLYSLVCSLYLIGLVLPIQPPWATTTHLTWLDAPTDRADFRRAIAPQPWEFPQDFGAHNDYQTEWWYYTGNLETAEGRPFGFQLTFFRQALTSPAIAPSTTFPSPSSWRSPQVYSAHLTLSDIQPQHFYPYERFSRGTVNLAGAEANPYHVWLEDWSATEVAPGTVRLQAQTPDIALDLVVTQTLPPLLHGDRGFSIKGSEPGNASYYYSLVQQPTVGTLAVQGQAFEVTGVTWKDHEYSTSSLSPGTVGWDWFSMQFENGAALMLYKLRHDDGTVEPTSSGTFLAPDGTLTPLTWQDWQLAVSRTWKSPNSGAIYPAEWTLTIPKLDLTLQGQPLMADQELHTATATYWEGAVGFQGTWHDRPLQGKGYVELTGYADRLDALLAGRT